VRRSHAQSLPRTVETRSARTTRTSGCPLSGALGHHRASRLGRQPRGVDRRQAASESVGHLLPRKRAGQQAPGNSRGNDRLITVPAFGPSDQPGSWQRRNTDADPSRAAITADQSPVSPASTPVRYQLDRRQRERPARAVACLAGGEAVNGPGHGPCRAPRARSGPRVHPRSRPARQPDGPCGPVPRRARGRR
jgi:hypothetical protein